MGGGSTQCSVSVRRDSCAMPSPGGALRRRSHLLLLPRDRGSGKLLTTNRPATWTRAARSPTGRRHPCCSSLPRKPTRSWIAAPTPATSSPDASTAAAWHAPHRTEPVSPSGGQNAVRAEITSEQVKRRVGTRGGFRPVRNSAGSAHPGPRCTVGGGDARPTTCPVRRCATSGRADLPQGQQLRSKL